jgi:hypothetical protein
MKTELTATFVVSFGGTFEKYKIHSEVTGEPSLQWWLFLHAAASNDLPTNQETVEIG